MSSLNTFDMELTQKLAQKYKKAKKKEKTLILKEYCFLTNISTNTASKRFAKAIQNPKPRVLNTNKYHKKKGPKKIYIEEHRNIIKQCWILHGKICGELLHPVIYQTINQLEESGNLCAPSHVIDECKKISLATTKRIISTFPKSHSKRHKGNNDIYKEVPIQANFGKNTKEVGYTELDYVEHNGGNSAGRFLITETYVDLCTQWITRVAGNGKNQETIEQIHETYLARIYHQVREYHTDNVQTALKCLVERCKSIEDKSYKVSRSRPYKKNDNAHVEQKNGDKVRKISGYHRYEGLLSLKYLNELYTVEDLIANFFTPCQKLLRKEVNELGKVVRRKHDKAKTPYQRMIDQPNLSKEIKAKLKSLYDSLSLIELRDLSNEIRQKFYKLRMKFEGK